MRSVPEPKCLNMKATAIRVSITLALLIPGIVCADSWFYLRNRYPGFGIDAPVSDASGTPLAGTNYLAELWGGVADDSLTPTVAAVARTRVITPFTSRGYFDYLDPTGDNYPAVLNVNPGTAAALQVRAWDARLGATYEDAVAAGLGGYGESPVFFASGTSPFCEPPCAPAPLLGLQSFSLRPVPEPSTWILLGVGGIGLWWRLRRRV
jgi:PEP-CTERM motif-containing protein